MLDAFYLGFVVKELSCLIDSKVDKVNMISKSEIVLNLRTKQENYKLLISANPALARINLTNESFSNPKTPYMFCMLLRKKLLGASIKNIKRLDLERIVVIEFDAQDELYDTCKLFMYIELMGKHSNVILVENGKIVDSLKRVYEEQSSVREVFSGLKYTLPPKQEKLSIYDNDLDLIEKEIKNHAIKDNRDYVESYDYSSVILGISSVVANKMSSFLSVKEALLWLKNIENTSVKSYIIFNEKNNMCDFTFFCENEKFCKEQKSFNETLDLFYSSKDKKERFLVKSANYERVLKNNIDRLERKLIKLNLEHKKSLDNEKYKLCAELISANLYRINKGDSFLIAQNFYDNNADYKVDLDPSLSADKNIALYYKRYKKCSNATKKLVEQIEISNEELEYLKSVLTLLKITNDELVLVDIKEELEKEGYLKLKDDKKLSKKSKKTFTQNQYKPHILSLEIDEKYTVFVGRSNIQNEYILKHLAKKSDLWFHVKDRPGAYVVLQTFDNEKVLDEILLKCAEICYKYSSNDTSSKCQVDYTLVKNVKKIPNAKIGKVIYKEQKSIIVSL